MYFRQNNVGIYTYEDNIKDLLLTKGLQTSKHGDGVRSVARAETLAALRQLDGERKGLLLQFLSEADLLVQGPRGDAIIPLKGADLSRADLKGASLFGANLFEANLSYANLEEANLTNANLNWADLKGANLYNANFTNTTLIGANLLGARIGGIKSPTPLSFNTNFSTNLHEATMPDGSKHP